MTPAACRKSTCGCGAGSERSTLMCVGVCKCGSLWQAKLLRDGLDAEACSIVYVPFDWTLNKRSRAAPSITTTTTTAAPAAAAAAPPAVRAACYTTLCSALSHVDTHRTAS